MRGMFKYHGKSLTSFILMFIRYPRLIYRSNKSGKKLMKTLKEYNPPYEIPKYNKKMSFCNSKETYLRSTRLCKSTDEKIIAMANKLGSYNLSSREYAEAAFEFVYRSIKLRFASIRGAAETLKTGYGSCYDQSSLFIALCRSAGVPARYRIYRLEGYQPSFRQVIEEENETQLIDGLAVLASVAVLTEVEVDGRWIECDVVTSPELSAASNTPLIRFGEDFIQWAIGTPVLIRHLEELPHGMVFMSNIAFKMLKGIFDGHVRVSFEKLLDEGMKKLETLGEKKYNEAARRSYRTLPVLEKK